MIITYDLEEVLPLWGFLILWNDERWTDIYTQGI